MGVSLVPPEDVHLQPVGAGLKNANGKLGIVVRLSEFTPDDEAFLRAFFPTTEKLMIGARQATLWMERYALTPDSIALTIPGDRYTLTVMVQSDKRTDDEHWKALRESMLSVDWTPQEVDAESAFGLKTSVQGMHLEKNPAVRLVYVPNEPMTSPTTFEVSWIPFDLGGGADCASLLPEAEPQEKILQAPTAIPDAHFRGCEMETSQPGERTVTYSAALKIPNSTGVVMAIGVAPRATFPLWRARFRDAVRKLEPSR